MGSEMCIRDSLLDHPHYYHYREELLDFLEAYEGGANPDPETLEAIKRKRSQRIQTPVNATAAILEESAV